MLIMGQVHSDINKSLLGSFVLNESETIYTDLIMGPKNEGENLYYYFAFMRKKKK